MSQSPSQPSGTPGAAPASTAASAPAAPASGPAPARKPAPQQQRPKQVGPTIDPVRVLRQHAWLLGGAAMVGAVLGVVVNYAQLFLYPVWTGSAVFEVAPEIKDVGNPLATDNTLEETVARVGQTESRRMISKRVLEAAMKRPDIATTAWGKAYPTVDERVEELEKTLRAGHIRGTSNFSLSWSTQVKEDIPVVLNGIANTYMEQRRSGEDERARKSLDEFVTKRDALDKEIDDQKRAIEKYIATNNVTDAASGSANLELRNQIENTQRQRDEASQVLVSAKTRRMLVERKLELNTYEDADRSKALEDFTIRQLERDCQQLEVAVNAARVKYGPEHRELKSLEQRAQAADDKFNTGLKEIMRRNVNAEKIDLDTRVAQFTAVVQDQTAQLESLEKRLNEQTAKQQQLKALQSVLEQREKARETVQNFIMQLELVRVREDAQRVRLVQLAVTPREITFPRLEFYIPIGAVLGLAVVAGVVFLREFLDQRVRFPADMAGMAGCRLLGVVPDLTDDPGKPTRPERCVKEAPNSVTAEMFRQAAAQVRKGIDAGGFRVIAVLSAHPEAGVSTVISNLAGSLTSVGRNVAVVDANFRRPGLAALFGVDPDGKGLGDMLHGQPVEPTVVDGIAVFGAGTPSQRTFELLSGDQMARILQELRKKYDIVLVDLPPTLVAGETLVVTHASDAALLVVRAMQDQRGLVGKVIGQLLDTRAALLGAILMRPEHTAGGYFRKNAEVMTAYAQGKTVTAPEGKAAKKEAAKEGQQSG